MLRLLALILLALPCWGQATATYIGTTYDEVDRSTYDFTSQSLGAEASDRCIVVIATARDSSTATTLTSMTIAGTAATMPFNLTNPGGGATSIMAIGFASVPTGTTGTIQVVYDQLVVRAMIAVYRVTGADCTAAHDSDSATGTTFPLATTIDVPADGVAISGAMNGLAGVAYSWTNLTEDAETSGTNFQTSSAHDEFGTTQTGLSVTASYSGSVAYPISVTVSFAPVAGSSYTPRRRVIN